MQETLKSGRTIRKLYANVERPRKESEKRVSICISIRDNYGKVLEEYREFLPASQSKSAEYFAAVKALEISAKYCRGRIYIFTENRFLVNHFYGSYRIKNREIFKLLMEIKLLEGFFKCVRMFYVRRAGTS